MAQLERILGLAALIVLLAIYNLEIYLVLGNNVMADETAKMAQ
jgi:hypothetical protein